MHILLELPQKAASRHLPLMHHQSGSTDLRSTTPMALTVCHSEGD
jgi:hypothetical protein